MAVRSRVFISCGQENGSDEPIIAGRIADQLRKMGFDPYVAIKEQSLRGVKENIFRQLETSEYFLFIDFKREQLSCNEKCRGSLFSHQELAIAAYCDKEVIAFREKGTELNGVARYIQANPIEFSDKDQLIKVVIDEVRERGWETEWRSKLQLDATRSDIVDANIGTVKPEDARFFYVTVKNLHHKKMAINCYAYLEKIKNLASGDDNIQPTIEYKWQGYVYPNASIAPNSARKVDAFWILHDSPEKVQFNTFASYTGMVPIINSPGTYSFTYRIIAENFPSVKAQFRVKIASQYKDTYIELED